MLNETERIALDHDKAIADYTAHRIAGLITPVMVKNTTRLIRFLHKSLSSS